MNTSKIELVAALRELANRIEAADMPEDVDIRIEIESYRCYDIERLRFIASLMDGEPKPDKHKGTHWLNGMICGFKATVYYPAGLLGKVRVRKVAERATETTPDLSLLK